MQIQKLTQDKSPIGEAKPATGKSAGNPGDTFPDLLESLTALQPEACLGADSDGKSKPDDAAAMAGQIACLISPAGGLVFPEEGTDPASVSVMAADTVAAAGNGFAAGYGPVPENGEVLIPTGGVDLAVKPEKAEIPQTGSGEPAVSALASGQTEMLNPEGAVSHGYAILNQQTDAQVPSTGILKTQSTDVPQSTGRAAFSQASVNMGSKPLQGSFSQAYTAAVRQAGREARTADIEKPETQRSVPAGQPESGKQPPDSQPHGDQLKITGTVSPSAQTVFPQAEKGQNVSSIGQTVHNPAVSREFFAADGHEAAQPSGIPGTVSIRTDGGPAAVAENMPVAGQNVQAAAQAALPQLNENLKRQVSSIRQAAGMQNAQDIPAMQEVSLQKANRAARNTGGDTPEKNGAEDNGGKTVTPLHSTGSTGQVLNPADAGKLSLPKEAAGEQKFNAADVGRQLADACETARSTGRNEMRLHLSPEDLGGVNIRIVSQAGAYTIQITADSRRTGELLASNLGDLTHALNQNGLNMDRTEVHYAANSSFDAFSGNSGGERQGGYEYRRPQAWIPVRDGGEDQDAAAQDITGGMSIFA